ncbi:hypothetical protein [Streptomyces sp. NPDC088755]|uniref:hypothetical protein n=1 Tax=Streptomyces sp. NPDC088755 TaxID=3365888 RepID=UPI0038301BBA
MGAVSRSSARRAGIDRGGRQPIVGPTGGRDRARSVLGPTGDKKISYSTVALTAYADGGLSVKGGDEDDAAGETGIEVVTNSIVFGKESDAGTEADRAVAEQWTGRLRQEHRPPTW